MKNLLMRILLNFYMDKYLSTLQIKTRTDQAYEMRLKTLNTQHILNTVSNKAH